MADVAKIRLNDQTYQVKDTEARKPVEEELEKIRNKGQEVLESIPEKYTALTGDVANLKNAVENLVSGVNPSIAKNNLLKYAAVRWDANNDHRSVEQLDDGSFHVWTDETFGENIHFFSNVRELPAWIIPGCTYTLKYHADVAQDLYRTLSMRIYVWKDGKTADSAGERILLTATNTTFTIPINTTGIAVRLQKDAGYELDAIFKPELYLISPGSDAFYNMDADMQQIPLDVVQWQDFVQVGNEIWLFASSTGADQSVDDHTVSNGYIYRINKDDYSYIGAIQHNLGHCNGVDYDADHDALLVTSGLSRDKVLTIYKNVASWAEGSSIDYNDLEKVILDLSGSGHSLEYMCACWGEKKQNGYRYIYIASSIGALWLKIDVNVSDNFYVNTYSIQWTKSCNVSMIDGVTTAQVLQGMKMHGGKIYASISHNSVFGAVYTINNSNVARDIIHVDGSGLTSTNEGCTVIDDELLLGISTNHLLAKIKIPLTNESLESIEKQVEVITKRPFDTINHNKIVLLGDSIVQGVGSSDYSPTGEELNTTVYPTQRNVGVKCWGSRIVALLNDEYGCTAVNNGVSQFGMDHLQNNLGVLLPSDTDYAVVMIGTNNRNSSKANCKTMFESLMDAIMAKGVQPFVFSPIPMNTGTSSLGMGNMQKIFENVCREKGIPFFPLFTNFGVYISEHGLELSSCYADWGHPNDKGHEIIFNYVRKCLEI